MLLLTLAYLGTKHSVTEAVMDSLLWPGLITVVEILLVHYYTQPGLDQATHPLKDPSLSSEQFCILFKVLGNPDAGMIDLYTTDQDRISQI